MASYIWKRQICQQEQLLEKLEFYAYTAVAIIMTFADVARNYFPPPLNHDNLLRLLKRKVSDI